MTKRVQTSERKRRPDCWEIRSGLNQEQIRQAFAWARDLGYARAIGLVAKEFHVAAPSIAAFSNFYDMFSRVESEERVHKAIADSGAIRALAAKTGDVSEAMLAALESEASAALLGNDPERIKLLVGLALKARSGKRDDAALRLQTDQFEEQKRKNAEARSALEGVAKAGGLDAETLSKIEEAAKLL